MANIIKNKLRESFASSTINEILTRVSRYYYFLGRTTDFVGADGTPLTTQEYEQKVRTDMVYLKSISVSDVALVIPRINWSSGINTSKYDSRVEESVNTSYVITDLFNVYKCLDRSTANSTIKPTGTSPEPFVTADGFKWKFMYNVPLALRNKFLTGSYIPVSNALTDRFYSAGSIEKISIVSNGSGYDQSTCRIIVTGDGVGASLTPVIQGGQLVGVTIVDAGTGYTYANVEVESTVNVGTVAVLQIDLSTGDVINPQSVVEMLAIRGTIDSYTVIGGGTGYTSATVAIVGDGTGAAATVTIIDGSITKINVTSIGSGYTYANVTISGDGTDASAYANVSPPLGHGRSAVSELNASSIMFYGNLTQDTADTVVFDNEYRQFGIIKNPRTLEQDTFIPAPSSSYHYSVTGVFDSAQFVTGTSITDGTNTFTVGTVSVGTSISGMVVTTGGIAISNGTVLTKVGSPGVFFTVVTAKKSELITALTTTPCYIVGATFLQSNYPTEAILYNGANRFRVVSSSPTQLMLLPVGNSVVDVNDVLNIEGGTLTLLINSVIEPSIDKATGDILFIDNRTAFNQTEDQAVTFRTVIKV